MKPAPAMLEERCTALTTSRRPRSLSERSPGRARTSIRRVWPPNTSTRATPGTARRRGRTCHCTRLRSCMGSSRALVKPTFSTSPAGETSGSSLGGSTPAGSALAPSARRPTRRCCTCIGSARGAKSTVITDRPWIDCERTAATPASPIRAASRGRLTSRSTCSATRPGASVWMVAEAALSGGNISRGAP